MLVPFFLSTAVYERSSAYISLLTLGVVSLFNFSHTNRYFIIVLSCISIKTSNSAEHLCMSWSTIYIISLVKCLFKYFVHSFIDLFMFSVTNFWKFFIYSTCNSFIRCVCFVNAFYPLLFIFSFFNTFWGTAKLQTLTYSNLSLFFPFSNSMSQIFFHIFFWN